MKNFTLTPWAACATNISCGLIRNWWSLLSSPHPGRQRRSINSERGWTPRLGWNCQLWKCSLCTGPLSLYFPLSDLFWAVSSESQFLHQTRLILCPWYLKINFQVDMIQFMELSAYILVSTISFLRVILKLFWLKNTRTKHYLTVFQKFWDPSQMITWHLKKIPKLLLTGGVVQFRHDVNQFFPQSGSYGVFTAVSSFRSWIDRTLSKYGGEELVCSWLCFYLKSSFCRGALYKECEGWTFFGLYKDSLLLLRSLVKDCSHTSIVTTKRISKCKITPSV